LGLGARGTGWLLSIDLEPTLTRLHRTEDLILLYHAFIEAKPDSCFEQRAKLAALLLKTGDKNGFGELYESLLFHPSADKQNRGGHSSILNIDASENTYLANLDIIQTEL
jgi:hypothetical protein